MFIHKVPKLATWAYKDYIWHKSRTKKEVFLTFDDGPVHGPTDYILDLLAIYDMKATFFMVGENIRKSPDLALSVASAGHSIGNHTQNHLKGTEIADRAYIENTHQCHLTITTSLNRSTRLFRPPYGKLRSSQKQELLKYYDIIFWDLLSGDFKQGVSPATSLKKLKANTENGSIILFHDQPKTWGFLKAMLPDYLHFLKSEGYATGIL